MNIVTAKLCINPLRFDAIFSVVDSFHWHLISGVMDTANIHRNEFINVQLFWTATKRLLVCFFNVVNIL